MKFIRTLFVGLLGALLVVSARAQFSTNGIQFLSPTNFLGSNQPVGITASNVFYTNAIGPLTASNPFTGGAQRVGVVTAYTNAVPGTNNFTGTNFIYASAAGTWAVNGVYSPSTNLTYLGGSGYALIGTNYYDTNGFYIAELLNQANTTTNWGLYTYNPQFGGNVYLYYYSTSGATNRPPTSGWITNSYPWLTAGTNPAPTIAFYAGTNSLAYPVTNTVITYTTNYP